MATKCKICNFSSSEKNKVNDMGTIDIEKAIIYIKELNLGISKSSIKRHFEKHALIENISKTNLVKIEHVNATPTTTGDIASPKNISTPSTIGDIASPKNISTPSTIGDVANPKNISTPSTIGDVASPENILKKTRNIINKRLNEYNNGDCPFPKNEIYALCALEKVYVTDSFSEIFDLDNFEEKRFKQNIVKKLRFLLDMKMTGHTMGKCRFPKDEGMLLNILEKTYENDLTERSQEHFYGPNDKFVSLPCRNDINLTEEEFENYRRFIMMELGLSTKKPTSNVIIIPRSEDKSEEDSNIQS